MSTRSRTTRAQAGKTATNPRDRNKNVTKLTTTSHRRRTSDASASSSEIECNRRASSTEIVNLLDAPSNQTCLDGSQTMHFWESGIIAERKNKIHKKVKDYLVEALPVWRRAGVDGGPEPDHIEEWMAVERGSGFHLESEKYDFVVHRMHPRFEKWTGADEVFARGLEAETRRERDDDRDREKAMEMLGYLIERVVQEVDAEVRSWLHDHWEDVFINTKDTTSGVATTPREASARGWKFMRNTYRKDRQDIGQAIIFRKETPICCSWTNAFCIALLPPEDILAAWKEIKERSKRYRSAITTVLEAYHDDGIHNEESFIYVLRTFYTLTAMLRQIAEGEIQEAEYRDSIYDKSSQSDSDVCEDEDDNADVVERDSERSSPHYNRDTSSRDEEEDEDWEPETVETRIQALEEATRKETEGATPGGRVTRGQKRTRQGTAGREDERALLDSVEVEGHSGYKKIKT